MDKDKLNTEADKLKLLLDELDSDVSFDATLHLINDDTLPKPGNTIFRDSEAEKVELDEKARTIIDAIARNYIESDAIYNMENNIAIRSYQATKLAELQFLIDSARDNIVTIQQALDGGDINPQMFKAKVDYHKDMRESLMDREKHMANVEAYWEKKALTLGKEESVEIKESMKESTIGSVTEEEEEHPQKKYTVLDHRGISSAVDAVVKKKADENDAKKKELEDELKNLNPLDNNI